MNTATTPSQAVGYDAGDRSYGMPGSIVRTAYLMREKETNMTMASKATASYNQAYPDGYDPVVGITLYDHIADNPRFPVVAPEGFDLQSIIFVDGSRIDPFGEEA